MPPYSDKFFNVDYSTIKNFPFMMEHAIEMSKIYFEEYFT